MKTRNEILKDEENDRFIFIQYKEDKDVEWINFHQGLCQIDESFNKPCDKLTKIFKAMVNREGESETAYFRKDLTRAISLYNEIHVLPEMDREEAEDDKLGTYKATEELFRDLITVSGTYFLSDYVVNELEGYVEEPIYHEFCERLASLEILCGEHGLDIHEISQKIGASFIEGQGDTDHSSPKKKSEFETSSDEHLTKSRYVFRTILVHVARTWERIRMSQEHEEMSMDNIGSVDVIMDITQEIFEDSVIQAFICNEGEWDWTSMSGCSASDSYIELLAFLKINKEYV